jgi:outer membrane protein OmpA-like peptidoglycan-associated protein
MRRSNLKNYLLIIGWLSLSQLPVFSAAAQSLNQSDNISNNIPKFRAIVNSNEDGIRADDRVTLREAIAVVNGTITLENLSPQERSQIQLLDSGNASRIEFNLPAGQTKIELTQELPPIQVSGVTIDGTTQAGYIPPSTTRDRVVMSTPIVEITVADNVEIARGISILADRVTVKGLSIYGFYQNFATTQNGAIGDIFISDRLPDRPSIDGKKIPKFISIENNFLGITPSKQLSFSPSSFGVNVFNSQDVTIKNNVISNHTASGIVTAIKADNLVVEENVIVGNGTAGMPDAIRLEGEIQNNQIKTNLICGNDGSGIFVFKPAIGSVNIQNNTIKFNGLRFRRAAIHLMGNDHQVLDNNIAHQSGAGITVTAFSQPHSPTGDTASARNIFNRNRFSSIEGLSVDLNTYRNNAVEDFANGDGINPPRNSENRRRDTGNMAINAPQFLAREFLFLNDRVNIDGIADPGSTIELYKVSNTQDGYGALSRSLGSVTVDAQGKFGMTLTNLKPGEAISAIASDPKYGTSEPARTAIVTLSGATSTPAILPPPSQELPQCVGDVFAVPKLANADPQPPTPTPTPTPTPPPLPAKIRLEIPANVHFALDKSNIAPKSGEVIKRIAKVLKANPYIVVDLEGHTDPRASSDYNQKLGLRRAKSARDYLVRQGIAPERITIRSYGETKLKSRRTNITDYARNRRVEFFYRDVRGVELEIIEQENDLQLERQ